MNEEEESIKRIQELTTNTFTNFKTNLSTQLSCDKYGLCAFKFNECISALESMVIQIVGEMGKNYINMSKKMGSVSDVVEQLKSKGESLRDQLLGTRLLLEEKNSQIIALQEANSNLEETILALQREVSAGAEEIESISEDSLDGVNSDDLGEYLSSQSSEEVCDEGEQDSENLM